MTILYGHYYENYENSLIVLFNREPKLRHSLESLRLVAGKFRQFE
jgi:hypothetical protein